MKPDLTSHLLVFMQFTGILLSTLPFDASMQNSWYFLFLCVLGLMLGFYTLLFNQVGNFRVYPELKSQSKLVTAGPYRFIRHPMYACVILCVSGAAFYRNHPANYLGLVLVMTAVTLKAHKEERLLLEKFPDYKNYMQRTSRFIPWIL